MAAVDSEFVGLAEEESQSQQSSQMLVRSYYPGLQMDPQEQTKAVQEQVYLAETRKPEALARRTEETLLAVAEERKQPVEAEQQ